MKTRTTLVCLAATGVLAGSLLPTFGEARPNPYQSIIDRNAFALKPPPPPPDPAASLPPPPPPSNVKLTGITSMFGPSSKRAMLEIQEVGPGKLPKKPTLKEGEREGGVEVVSIDVEKGQVKILNNGVESVIGFATNDVAKAISSPVTANLPGMPMLNTAFQPLTPPPPAGNVAVPLPGANADSGRTKVAMSSGDTTASGLNAFNAGAAGTISPGGTQPPGAYSGVNVSAANPGYNNIPTRNLRVPTTTTVPTDGSAPAKPQYTREQIELLIEAQKMKGVRLPLPNTSFNP